MAELGQWQPRCAWAGITAPGRFGAEDSDGVTAVLLDGQGLASLIAAPGEASALSDRVAQRLSLVLPTTPGIVHGAGCDAIWAGPDQWLLRTASRQAMAPVLDAFAQHAAITDQSDARAALRLSGPRLRDALAKGCMIDLHPAVFAVGDAALTSIAHCGVQLWRLPDAESGPVFEILVARSYAGSFWSWFAASAAEFGCRIVGGRG